MNDLGSVINALNQALPGRATVIRIARTNEIHCRVDDSRSCGDKVLVLVRPESVHLSRHAQTAEKNVWPGEVKAKTFMGDFIDCEVACDGLSLRAKIDPYSDLRETDMVYVSVDPSRCAVIPVAQS